MEGLRGPINSFFFGEKMSSEMGYQQVSYLRLLNGVTQSEEEHETEQEEEEMEDKKLLRFQIQQEANLQRLVEIHNRYNPAAKIESLCPPPPVTEPQQLASCITQVGPSNPAAVGPKERKKRKRTRAPPVASSEKDAKETESQRMNHIAVERNRRRLMNSHLSTLRSLMPQSFVQRGDQASIVAGAIDFVKQLEQLLLSLQAKKRKLTGGDTAATPTSASSSSCTNDEEAQGQCESFLISPQYTGYSEYRRRCGAQGGGGGIVGADVEATVVQGHVNLKVVGPRRRGQLVRAIAAVEGFGLTVLHLNVTKLDNYSILYSLNLKMEEECKLGSADEIATAVHHVFGYISGCC